MTVEIFAQVEQRQVMLGRSERLSRRLMRRQVDHNELAVYSKVDNDKPDNNLLSSIF